MAPTMKLVAKTCFTKAVQVIDRFHVQKLAMEALQQIRIEHRWEAIDQENDAILLARKTDKEYKPELLLTGDTRKQLLARSRYLLYKGRENWTIKPRPKSQIVISSRRQYTVARHGCYDVLRKEHSAEYGMKQCERCSGCLTLKSRKPTWGTTSCLKNVGSNVSWYM